MKAQTFLSIIPRSPATAIAPCKKETRSNSKSFRDRKARKRPTSQRAGAEIAGSHLAGRTRLCRPFFLEVEEVEEVKEKKDQQFTILIFRRPIGRLPVPL